MIYTNHESISGKGLRPSTAILVILNGLLYFGLLAFQSTIVGLILVVPATLAFMVCSALVQVAIRRTVEKRYFLKPTPRIIAYTLPLWILMALPLLGFHVPQKINQQSPVSSLDGHYECRVSSPTEGWRIEITDTKSKEKWIEKTDFVAHLNIYWIWDTQSRLWIYNSDNGNVYFTVHTNGGWKMTEWGFGKTKKKEIPQDIIPPEDMYPDHANNHRK